jgi:hypothetical protein
MIIVPIYKLKYSSLRRFDSYLYGDAAGASGELRERGVRGVVAASHRRGAARRIAFGS